MSSVFTSHTNATAVQACVTLCFQHKCQENLILAKRNLLQIYRITTVPEDSEKADTELAQDQISSRLILDCEYTLFGTVIGLSAIRAKDYEETGLEYLLVSFETAKVSLLRWQQDIFDLVTVSLHSFERDEYRPGLSATIASRLRSDPQHRVSTLLFNNQYLAFLPIVQKDELLIDENQEEEQSQGYIDKSFVLTALQLEDDITQLVDFTYLDGYREPTMAILYASQGTTTGLQLWRKDCCQLVVTTLDLQAGARTAIFEVTQLPSDLESVVTLREPIGGCLLLGHNELIYVDPASRKVALAVNAFASKASDMSMRDYSHLDLRLEGAKAVPLQASGSLDAVLIVLSDGRAAILTLNLDGRTVTSLHLSMLSEELGGLILTSEISCSTLLKNNSVFIGSCVSNSKLLSWRLVPRESVTADTSGPAAVTEKTVNDDDLDDLYGDDVTEKRVLGAETTVYDVLLQSQDTLFNHGATTGMTLGLPYNEAEEREAGLEPEAEVAVVGGAGRAGNLTIYRKSIAPETIGKFEASGWKKLWTVNLKDPSVNAATTYDTYLMASKEEETQVFTVENAFVEKLDSEFDLSIATISVGTLLDSSCTLQVTRHMLRTYDTELRLLEKIQTPKKTEVSSASVCDPYVLLLLDDSTVLLYSIDKKSRELRQLNSQEAISDVSSAVLYTPKRGSPMSKLVSTGNRKRKRGSDSSEHPSVEVQGTLCIVLSNTNELRIHQLPSMKLIFTARDSSRLPDIMHNELTAKANGINPTSSQQPKDIVEICVANLGHREQGAFLILRNSSNSISVYQPFTEVSGECNFKRIQMDISIRSNGATEASDLKVERQPMMTPCRDIDGLACLFITGSVPYWLIKTDHSLPALHTTRCPGITSLASFNTADAKQGYIYCSEGGTVRICRFPAGFQYENKWSFKTISIGRSAHGVAYVPAQQVYAISTSEAVFYEIPDEEDETWQPRENDRNLLPTIPRGSIELLDTSNHKLTDKYELAENEQALALKTVTLTVATDYTRKRRTCLAVSTAIYRGEDLAMRGAVYVFDVVEVVPEVDKPEDRYRLRNICREEVKAAATTLCEVDGYLLSSQGQKVVIRSLEEDERLTPVAFVDLGIATTTAKCIRSLILFGDVQSGVRFTGFGEEPYKVTSFGRDYDGMEVLDAEFIVLNEALYFASSDPYGNLRILQYDPENPITLGGSRLVRKADVHTGHPISCMLLIVDPNSEFSATASRTGVLCASLDGSISSLLPVSERSYRRLYTVQSQMSSSEVQVAGLNPRAYRMSTMESATSNAARGILDGQLLTQFANLSFNQQTQLAQKSGLGVENVLCDLEEMQHFLKRY